MYVLSPKMGDNVLSPPYCWQNALYEERRAGRGARVGPTQVWQWLSTRVGRNLGATSDSGQGYDVLLQLNFPELLGATLSSLWLSSHVMWMRTRFLKVLRQRHMHRTAESITAGRDSQSADSSSQICSQRLPSLQFQQLKKEVFNNTVEDSEEEIDLGRQSRMCLSGRRSVVPARFVRRGPSGPLYPGKSVLLSPQS